MLGTQLPDPLDKVCGISLTIADIDCSRAGCLHHVLRS
ncbi:MAG: Uncharacterised protein [Halieaceae bacterium]|nr:MAG: Uncharacterised protein [Halieaceae bacterium]